jgi:transcriptional regulator with XRE-family HTH domain
MNKEVISPEPGKRVRDLREKLGLTREEFHKETGISASTLRAWEVGEVKLAPSKALTLSHMFILLFKLTPEEASVDALLHGKKERPAANKTKKPVKQEAIKKKKVIQQES